MIKVYVSSEEEIYQFLRAIKHSLVPDSGRIYLGYFKEVK
jgi:hypothetical protein